jgi:hypothetical protein
MSPSPPAHRTASVPRATGDAGAAAVEYVLIVVLLVLVGFGAASLLNRYEGGRPLLGDSYTDPSTASFPDPPTVDEPPTPVTAAPTTTTTQATTTTEATTTTIARRAPTTRPSRTTARRRG